MAQGQYWAKKLQDGSFRQGFGPGLWGFNPFASRTMKDELDALKSRFQTDSGYADSLSQYLAKNKATMNPENAQKIEQQLAEIKARMDTMRKLPGIDGGGSGTTTGGGSGDWYRGVSTWHPGYGEGFAVSPYDHRRDPYSRNERTWDDLLRSSEDTWRVR